MLKQFALDSNPRERFMPKMDRLPKQLRQLATTALDCAVNRSSFVRNATFLDLGGLSANSLTKLFAVFFPGLENSALATWKSLATGPYCDFTYPALYRSPRRSDLTIRKQVEWFGELVRVFVNYDSNVASAKGLAVWAPYLEEQDEDLALFGPSFEGREAEDHVGRLLASVIDGNGDEAQSVWDSLRLTLEGKHESSMFGGHIVRAFWRCNRPEAHDRLRNVLASFEERTVKKRRVSVKTLGDPRYYINIHCILRGLTESTHTNVKTVLQLVLAHRCLLSERIVVANVLDWLGVEFSLEPVYVREKITAALNVLESPVGVSDESHSLAARTWRKMIDDVELAHGMLCDLMQHPEAELRLAGIDLATSSKHPSILPLVAKRFADEDVRVATHALFAIRPKCEDSRDESLVSLINLFSRVLKLGRKLKSTIKIDRGTFILRITNELKTRWTTESLAMLGECWSIDPTICFWCLPNNYIPPDQASVELLLTQVQPFHNLTGDWEYTDNQAVLLLMRAELTPENWVELISRIDFKAEKLPTGLLDVLSASSEIEFERTTRLLLSSPQSQARIAGLKVLNQYCGGQRHASCLRIVQEFLLADSFHPKLELEASLLRKTVSGYM